MLGLLREDEVQAAAECWGQYSNSTQRWEQVTYPNSRRISSSSAVLVRTADAGEAAGADPEVYPSPLVDAGTSVSGCAMVILRRERCVMASTVTQNILEHLHTPGRARQVPQPLTMAAIQTITPMITPPSR